MIKTDYLIIGSGIAGLTFAYKIANRFPDKQVTIITKGDELETNTKYAQGGIAGVFDSAKDSCQSHIEDTLVAGAGLCNPKIVEIVVTEGPERILEIIKWGANFDRNQEGGFHLGKEAGHSFNRILHNKDITGLEIERALLEKIKSSPNIEILSHHFAIDLIVSDFIGRDASIKKCSGAYVLNLHTGITETVISNITMLATGGVGQVYKHTTNPIIATGDGIAMAFRANVKLNNMEFIQFHPTAMFEPGKNPLFLISEVVRGMGAKLKNISGKEFMSFYHQAGSMAPRDIVARGIFHEIKKAKSKFVYLDCRSVYKEVESQCPNIYKKCLSIGINLKNDMIPVVPAAHYICGGIKTDEWGRTSLNNLYAGGECASTGLHGANRLASNSLLEALVFSHRSYIDAGTIPSQGHSVEVKTLEQKKSIYCQNLIQNKEALKNVMSSHVGIIRNSEDLLVCNREVNMIYQNVKSLIKNNGANKALMELLNLVTVGANIAWAASTRTTNVGLHYNIDHTTMKERKSQ